MLLRALALFTGALSSSGPHQRWGRQGKKIGEGRQICPCFRQLVQIQNLAYTIQVYSPALPSLIKD
jgi:hypothetical protein